MQAAVAEDGRTVTATMLDHLRHLNAGAAPLGSFGAVVGATIGETADSFDVNGPVLAPGYGAQGGTNADLPRIFGESGFTILRRPEQLPKALLGVVRQMLGAKDR